MKTVRIKKTFDFPVPREKLWPWAADNDKIDQVLGLPPVSYRTVPGAHHRLARLSLLGFPIEWKENPFEWVEPEWVSVEREYSKNPLAKRLLYHLSLEDKGLTQVELDVSLDLRHAWLYPLGVLFLRLYFYKFERLFRQFEEAWRKEAPTPYQLRHSPVNQPLLQSALERLKKEPVRADLADRLGHHILTAFDSDCLHMRPFAVAEAWKADRMEVLRLFLYATRAGLLNLSWEVICPNCRISKASVLTLRELKNQIHCETCQIRFDANFDQYVELRFSVNPAVREAKADIYCIGAPIWTQHIVAERRVAAGARMDLPVRLPLGKYRLWTRSHAERMEVEVRPEGTASEARVTLGETLRGSPGLLRPGLCRFAIENQTGAEVLVMLEMLEWDPRQVSAAFVTTLQEFRQLFSSEALAPGLDLEIKSLTFLFSDLKGSTRLYESVGDSPAFALVLDHFSLLVDAVSRNRGGIVKTMGDAVMAVFTKPADAVRAAAEIQREAKKTSWREKQVTVKLGLHAGACLAVNGNDSVDYFGTTVNVAARVQGESLGGDLVFTEPVLEDPEVQLLLRAEGLDTEAFQVELKGLSGTFSLYRISEFESLPATGTDRARDRNPGKRGA